MEHKFEKNKPLPAFRRDLELYQGPNDADGSPTYNILDPVKRQYYKISWEQAVIINQATKRMSLNKLCGKINENTTLHVTHEDVMSFYDDAFKYNLLELPKSSDEIVKESTLAAPHLTKNLLQKYLHFRVPILKPDEFLSKTLPYFLPLASPIALWTYLFMSVMGILLLLGRLDEYINTFLYFFNLNGMFAYLVGIIIVKLIHEFAHAYAANYYKIHVSSMGIAFIILYPVLYTDVTDGWKLAKRKDRIIVSAAGICSELILAGICTLGWVLVEPGILKSIFYVISSITWISSIFINLNPAMRFDGYYLLSDIVGIDNLQNRAFALTKWWIKRHFFGLDLEVPEEKLTIKMQVGMIIYAIFTWIYRVFLYTLIAIVTYYTFTKAIGVLLFFVLIGMFIVFPIIGEIGEIMKLRTSFKKNPRLYISLGVIGILLALFILPLPHSVKTTAIIFPTEEQTVYIPVDGVIEKIFVKEGDWVGPDTKLITLSSKKLNTEITQTELGLKIIDKKIYILGQTDEGRSFIRENEGERVALQAQLSKLDAAKENLTVKAKIKGRVFAWDKELQENQYVSKNQEIGKIAAESPLSVYGFFPEDEIDKLEVGQEATFTRSSTLESLTGKIVRIGKYRETFLRFPSLASINNGPLAVKQSRKVEKESPLILLDSYYLVEIQIENPKITPIYGEHGDVTVSGQWSSYFVSLVKYLIRTVRRESSF